MAATVLAQHAVEGHAGHRAPLPYSLLLLVPAVILGLHMGLFPYVGEFFLRFVLFFDKIVALSLLPILFIAFGIDELSKIMLIVIGVTPDDHPGQLQSHARRAARAGGEGIHPGRGRFRRGVPGGAQTDRAARAELIRLNLKAVMLFLFAGEMIASTDGLAYRIALLRRHMGMDVIIPYVLWVALAAVSGGPRRCGSVNRKLHPWFTRLDDDAADPHRRRLRGLRFARTRRARRASTWRSRKASSSAPGQTGCGKSHAAAPGAGQRTPMRGRILMDGQEHPQPDRTRGYVPQKYSLFPDKTVLDNITFGPEVSEFSLFGRFTPAFFRRRGNSATRPTSTSGGSDSAKAMPRNIRTNFPAACSSAWRSPRR